MSNCLRLSKELYLKNIIEKVIEDYSEICNVKIVDEGNYFECIFVDTIMDMETTMKEFEDYLIGLTRKYEY